jgi:chromosomal replication initiator protein
LEQLMNTFWQSIKERLKNEIPENQYRMWIEPLDPVQRSDQELLLACPNSFFLNWVKEKYYATMVQLAQALDPAPKIILQVLSPEKAHAPSVRPQQFLLPGFARKDGLRFNGGFTFDQFVTGPSNDFAYLASMAMASDRNLHNNALYLFSSSGLGKTHLSQAVGNYILKHKPQVKVLYLSTEDFTNEMVSSLKNNSMNSFKDKFRKNCDFLLLEEVNFLSGKETTQAELGYTLDALLNDNKKIIFTSSLPPKDIPRLGSRLKSRLCSAILGSIEPPDFETRRGIVDKKSRLLGITLSPEVKEFMASKPFKDMRQLEGCLNRMSAQATLLNQPLDLSLAESVVEEQIQESKEISIQAIKALVGKYFQVSAEEMDSRSRKRVFLQPRNVSIYLSKKYTGRTLAEIGKAFKRDASSVIYAVNAVEKSLRKNQEFSRQVHFLSSQIEGAQTSPSSRVH